MHLIKVGAAVLNQTPRDWKGNVRNITDAINQAKNREITILCLPELCITGYGMEDDFFCPDVPARAMRKLAEIAKSVQATAHKNQLPFIFTVGLPIRFDNSLYNAVALVVNGKVAGFACKQHLAGDGIHYEPRWFKPWTAGVVQTIDCPELFQENTKIPIGDIHFSVGGVKIGFEVCEDAWVANRPGAVLASKGVDIILNPSASHFSFGKLNTRKNFVVDGSRAFNCTYVYSNLVGNEAGRAIYDGGALIASGGSLLAVGERFTYKNVLLTDAVVDIDSTRTFQVKSSSFQPNVEKFHDGCIEVPFIYPTLDEGYNRPIVQQPWELSEHLKHEECTRALGLALMDYMRKSKQRGFVVSLSGGADSAMVTYLCYAGIKLGIQEIGFKAFIDKYCPHLSGLSVIKNWNDLIKTLITTAYQATAQSGQVTRQTAKTIALECHTTHYEFDVEPVMQEYLKIGKIVNQKDLSFEENDLVMQNLQARTRSPSIWIIANLQNKLLLTTSNMSEAAVGYATMDGDTSGCVAPISGLPKVYVREYLDWVEHWSPSNTLLSPMDVMHFVNVQQPTAELRPASANQTDEKDLMPYDLLHMIQSLAVKQRCTPVEVFRLLRCNPTLTTVAVDLVAAIKKFFRLFATQQWKRERYALGFHLDDHNLDPRSWCRTSILSGCYEEELKELDEYVKTHH